MRILITTILFAFSSFLHAQEGRSIEKLALGDNDERIEAMAELVAAGNEKAAAALQALADSELYVSGKRVLIVKGGAATDAVTGEKLAAVPDDKEEVTLNNRVRRELAGALAALKLVSPDLQTRLSSVKELLGNAEPAMLPLVKKALEKESDAEVKGMLERIVATLALKSEDPKERLAAVQRLAGSSDPTTKTLLLNFLQEEKDEGLRLEAQKALRAIEAGLAWGDRLGAAFTSISLGSILLLAALGLAITYGLMGVINMAHGELIMIGAYATYVMQNLFRSTPFFDWYLVAAIPFAFVIAAMVGMLLERTVIRWLYGRPLETLLATWGISLGLIQTTRLIFGAQNVAVENPSWLSGGWELAPTVVL
ncbi:MAG TPA: urea ABC transporter permease subunit UrtB, partial [Burkholderiales bacterium]|nr:urea ABC transporter permease subunit UrtB [Burkholderiales bacterium]